MSKCYENFSMFDFTPQPQLPDNLLQLVDEAPTPEPLPHDHHSNLDIIVSKFLNN